MVEIVNGYLYPFRGILYLIRKKQLRKNYYLPILFSLIIDLIVLILMFKFAYKPQYDLINDHILTFFWPWLNHVINFIMIIIEVYIVAMIVINLFLGYFFQKAFDEVLVLKGYQHLLEQEDSSCLESCMRSIRLFQLIKIFVAILTLPFNFIPTIGSIAYYFCNGIMQGWDQQDRYFELKKINTTAEQWAFIKQHFKNMSTLGTVNFFLEALPIIGPFFCISNAVGIALYDCHLEKKNGNPGNAHSLDVGVSEDEDSYDRADNKNKKKTKQPKPTQAINTQNVTNYGSNEELLKE
ncbi:hypothetical protein BCR32DRAFT_275385 [Anaeromyces robustus]|uniref:EI24-domain-containing protein n=1 Tax=Anaeromyces robustus TaxID=1754192 RepID=A0A1Y1XL53_9FUNG|nr:hypothetical protein BCR32DRAFT_275385 [Anaeromyces robustus]|eukprot:ORX86435.1 hypothetical protein BCR32DRAFT_275385 [Anaeromyces robustus]